MDQLTTAVVTAEAGSTASNILQRGEVGFVQELVPMNVCKPRKGNGRNKYDVDSLSCVFSVRTGRTDRMQRFVCTVCGGEVSLGKTSKAMVRVEFVQAKGEVLCHRCSDIIIDIMRYGQVVIGSAFNWNLRSRMTGMSAVFDDIQCGKCLQRSMTHVVAKFNGLEKDGVVRRKSVKCCARCFMTFTYGVRATKLFQERLEYVPQIFASKRVKS